MKTIRSLALNTLLSAASFAPAAPLPLVWRAEWPDAKVEQRSVHRGTDVALAPVWVVNGRPADTNGWTFSTCVSTNGADWLEVPGLVFSHTNDCGAAQYILMVRAVDGGNVNYTANVRLRMLVSPGFTPAEVEWPVKRLDFAAVEVLNAPYYTKAEADAEIDARAAAPGNYAVVSNAAMSAVLTNAEGVVEGGLTVPTLTVGYRTDGSTVGENSVSEGYNTTASGLFSHAEGESTTASGGASHAEGSKTAASGLFAHTEGLSTVASNNMEHAQGSFNVSHRASGDFGDGGNTLSSIGFATTEGGRKNAVETMQDGKTFVLGIGGYDGTNPTGQTNAAQDLATVVNGKADAPSATDPAFSNAVVAVTTSEISREITIRLASTNAYISVSNGVQRIYEVDGTNRTLKFEWDMGFAAISNQVRTLVAQMMRKIEDTHTWSDYAASGVSNPFAGATTLDRGSVYFGGTNVQWTASNGFAVMTGHLPVAASGSASQFRIGVDADDWFGMEVVASYLVDAHSDSFRVVPAANDTWTATITTDYDSSYESAAPVVYHSVSLAEPFAELSAGVAWSHDASAHVSTVTIQGLTGSSGFFFLKKWSAGGAIMRSTMPFLPEGYRVETTGGEYVGTVQPDSIITIQSGGRNYRVIAEEAK